MRPSKVISSYWYPISVAAILGCAAAQAAAPTDGIDPRAEVGTAASFSVEDGEATASELLEHGFASMRAQEYVVAARSFDASIRTGNLNDAGRTLAYWHVYLAEHHLGNVDQGAEALSSFVVVAEDVLRDYSEYADRGTEDFIRRFDLSRRVSQARAVLSVLWSKRVPEYGRSLGYPIPVKSEAEMGYYIELISPCGQDVPQPLTEKRPTSEGKEVIRVRLACVAPAAPMNVFFERRQDRLF